MSLNIKTDGGKIKVADVGGSGSGNLDLEIYRADWISSGTSSVESPLTSSMTVPKGKYIAITQLPYVPSDSNADAVAGIFINNVNSRKVTQVTPRSNSVFYLDIENDNTTIQLKAVNSNVARYTYNDQNAQGYLELIKIG